MIMGFNNYCVIRANDICKESKRQTMNADDVFKALEDIEFPEFVGPLKVSLSGKYLMTRQDLPSMLSFLLLNVAMSSKGMSLCSRLLTSCVWMCWE